MHLEKTYTKENPKKPVRSKSGITPLTVVLKPKKCAHGNCIYCPGGDDVPQSYTNKSPAIMRAMALKYDIKKQVEVRLKSLIAMGHQTEKIELIIIGGTFLQYPIDYQYETIKFCYDVLNGKKSKNLEQSKKLNEKAKHRIVALCIENRPDNCTEKDIKRMLEFGCTRVEIGVQILDDKIYKKVNRGHTIKDVVDATEKLRNAGFKIGYHIMPGLPYSNLKKDLAKFKLIFKDERFRPDQLKIYPCQIVEGSVLSKIYKKINYQPYTNEQIKSLLKKMFKFIPKYCRVMRVMREIPSEKMKESIASTSMRAELNQELKNSGIKEIRMREIGLQSKENLNLKTKLKILEYSASKGKEYFLEIVNKEDILFGLLRLRIMNDKNDFKDNFLSSPSSDKWIFKTLTNSSRRNLSDSKISESHQSEQQRGKVAIIRELHVYGQALNLKEKGEISQHKGLGKQLMKEAEKIVKKNKCKIIKVISGVGVREYYKKLGYELDEEGVYMVKSLN